MSNVKAQKVNIIVEPKALTIAIEKFAKSEKMRDEEIHILACSVIANAYSTPGFSSLHMLEKLYKAMGKAAYKSGFIKWVQEYVPCTFDTKQGTFNPMPKKDAKGKVNPHYTMWEAKGYTFESCQAKTYWDFAPDKIEKPLDVLARVKMLVAEIEKREALITADPEKNKKMLKGSASVIAHLKKLAA